MQDGDYLALDIGEKRTGLARGSALARLAEPLSIVATADLLDELSAITSTKRVKAIIVGLPRNLDGKDTAQTDTVREWAAKIGQQLDTEIIFQDEALTTQQAAQRTGRDDNLDAEAAAIILQDFFDGQEK